VLAEVVPPPAAPVVLYGLAALGTFVAFIALWGLQHGWDATLGASLRWLGDRIGSVSIPTGVFGHIHPFGPIADAFHAVDRNVSHALAAAALSCQHAFTYTAGHTAQMARRLAHEVAAGAEAVYHAYRHFDAVVLPRWERHAAHRIERLVEAALAHIWKHILSDIRHLLRALHIARAQAHSTAVAVEHGFTWTRDRARKVERSIARHGRRLSRLEKILTVAGLTGLVGAVLPRLGLKWIRCPTVTKVGRSICGLRGSLIDDLLALFLAAEVIDHLPALVRTMQSVTRETAEGIQYIAGV
jgi:hypothetical protein